MLSGQLFHEGDSAQPDLQALLAKHIRNEPIDRGVLFEQGDDVVEKTLAHVLDQHIFHFVVLHDSDYPVSGERNLLAVYQNGRKDVNRKSERARIMTVSRLSVIDVTGAFRSRLLEIAEIVITPIVADYRCNIILYE